MQRAGFQVVYSKDLWRIGSAAWWVYGKLLRRRRIRPWQIRWCDRLLSLISLFDGALSLPPMSLIMVGRRPPLLID
jgi:hypothetical protein